MPDRKPQIGCFFTGGCRSCEEPPGTTLTATVAHMVALMPKVSYWTLRGGRRKAAKHVDNGHIINVASATLL
eukprot:1652716-Amphidinium_carterae.1